MSISPTTVAFFLLLTAIAYLIAYGLYVRQTYLDQPSFFYVAIFYLVAGFFFLIYAIVNYVWAVRGQSNPFISSNPSGSPSTSGSTRPWLPLDNNPNTQNVQVYYEVVNPSRTFTTTEVV